MPPGLALREGSKGGKPNEAGPIAILRGGVRYWLTNPQRMYKVIAIRLCIAEQPEGGFDRESSYLSNGNAFTMVAAGEMAALPIFSG